MQPQRGFDRAGAVTPQPGPGVEAVVGQQPPALGRDEVHRVDDVVDHRRTHEVVEVDPHPAGLDPLAAGGDLLLELVRALDVDAEQPVAVRPRARAAAAGLDPEQVVEQRDHEVVVQVAATGPAYDEGHDRQPLGFEVAEDLQAGVGAPGANGAAEELRLVRPDHLGPDRRLELEDQPGPDGLHNRRRTALLPVLRVGEVAVLGLVDVGDRPAARNDRDPVGEKFPAGDENARGSRSTDELVWRQEDGVLVGVRMLGAVRVHRDVDVRRGGGEVPERQRAVAVQGVGDPAGVRHDAGDVGCGGEGADLQRAVGVRRELGFQGVDVDQAVGVLRDDDDVGDRLPPGQLVGVVLERPDEHHRPAITGDVRAQGEAVVEVGRDSEIEYADEPVDRPGRARAAEQHDVLDAAANTLAYESPCVLAEPGGLQAGARGLGVGVGVAGEDLVPDEVLDERQRPAGGGVIGVGHPARAVRAGHDLVVADHRGPDPVEQRAGGQVGHPTTVTPYPAESAYGGSGPRQFRGAAVQGRVARLPALTQRHQRGRVPLGQPGAGPTTPAKNLNGPSSQIGNWTANAQRKASVV